MNEAATSVSIPSHPLSIPSQSRFYPTSTQSRPDLDPISIRSQATMTRPRATLVPIMEPSTETSAPRTVGRGAKTRCPTQAPGVSVFLSGNGMWPRREQLDPSSQRRHQVAKHARQLGEKLRQTPCAGVAVFLCGKGPVAKAGAPVSLTPTTGQYTETRRRGNTLVGRADTRRADVCVYAGGRTRALRMFLCCVHSMQNQCNPEFRFVWQLRRTDGTCGSPLERPEEGVACKSCVGSTQFRTDRVLLC